MPNLFSSASTSATHFSNPAAPSTLCSSSSIRSPSDATSFGGKIVLRVGNGTVSSRDLFLHLRKLRQSINAASDAGAQVTLRLLRMCCIYRDSRLRTPKPGTTFLLGDPENAPPSLRFSAVEPVPATAAPSSQAQSRSQRIRSRRFLCRAAPKEGASEPAWRVCRPGSRAGWPPGLQNLFDCPAASWDSGALNLAVPLAPTTCRSSGPATTPETRRRRSPAHPRCLRGTSLSLRAATRPCRAQTPTSGWQNLSR
jgi:hypothetical protein